MPIVSHRHLVSELAQSVGRARAEELDMSAEVSFLILQSEPEEANAQQAFDQAKAAMAAAAGPRFAARYVASLTSKLEALRHAHGARAELARSLLKSAAPEGNLFSAKELALVDAMHAEPSVKPLRDSVGLRRLVRELAGEH